MLARRRGGDRARARTVVALEAIKAACRLAMLQRTGARPGAEPPLPGRAVDPRAHGEAAAGSGASWDGMDAADDPDAARPPPRPEDWPMPRTNRAMPPLPHAADIPAYLLRRALTPDDVKTPAQLLRRLATARGQLAEVLWILRPLIYALLLLRYRGDKRKWTPWVVGLALELGARAMLRAELRGGETGGWRGMTSLEREEMQKRGVGLGWWLLRGAFYQNHTKYIFKCLKFGPADQACRHWMNAVTGKLKGVMLLDMGGSILEDYAYLWDEYYFSTTTT